MDWLNTIIRTFFDFGAMAEVLPQLLGVGLLNTLIISVAATIIGVALGMVVAVMGISPVQMAAGPGPDLHRPLPRPARDPDHPADRPGLRPAQPVDLRTLPLPAGHHRAEPDRQRLHRRNLPRRHPKRRQGPGRGLPGPGHELRQIHAPRGGPAGHPPGPAGPGEPVHRHRQGLLAGLLPGPAGQRTRTLPRRPGRRRPLRQPLAAGHGRRLLPRHHRAPDPPGQLLRQPLPHRPPPAQPRRPAA